MLGMAGVLTAGMFLGWLLSGGKNDKTSAPKSAALSVAPAVDLTEVVQQSLITRMKVGGYIEPSQVVRLTAQGGGTVVYLAGREGQSVEPGQVVVGLDEEREMADYRAAWARLSGEMSGIQNAQVQLRNKLSGPRTSPMGGPAYDAYDRFTVPFYNAMSQMMPFMGSGSPMMPMSSQQYSVVARNQARAEYEKQQASLVASQSGIDQIETALRNRRSMATFPAVILNKHVNLGDTVQPGQVLIELANTDELDLRIEIPARMVAELTPHSMIPVVLDGNVTVDAWVEQIYPAASANQHTVSVKLALPPGAPAAPGMYATALLPEPRTPGEVISAPVIPSSAIVYRGSLPSVFALGADGRVELRVIRTGESQGGRVVVLSGLKVGERVVTTPTDGLRSGNSLTGEPLAGESE